MTAINDARITAESVLAVLSGTPLGEVARRLGVEASDLTDAIDVYKAAGLAALRAQAADTGWYQVRVEFTNWDAAEKVAAATLGPALAQLQDNGQARAWWFIRKAPCWRLRLRPGPAAPSSMTSVISPVLDGLVADGQVRRWWETVYEPELAAFGTQVGMDIAHALFHTDSRNIMEHLCRPAVSGTASTQAAGRRELSVLLCTGMLRAAGLDWYEQGDVWDRVSRLRPLPPAATADQVRKLTESLGLLLTADTRPAGAVFGPAGPMASAEPWATAFAAAGHALGAATGTGTLQRGLRGILSHHIIFHWNRLGLTDRTQAILAAAARDTIMNHRDQHTGKCAADDR